MSGLLAGKRLLITGVITDASIAFSVARLAQENGATVVLTGFGRLSLVERIAKRLPEAAFKTSAYSLKALAAGLADLYPEEGAAVVGLDFDASVAWPVYDWMGVAKAALEATSRYLARDLGPKGVRVNLVSAGPLGTLAARGIPGFGDLATAWQQQAPLGWDTDDPAPVAGAILFLFSDLSRAVTGEILHVDGGFHAMGTAVPA